MIKFILATAIATTCHPVAEYTLSHIDHWLPGEWALEIYFTANTMQTQLVSNMHFSLVASGCQVVATVASL